ncbi:hypothetical protein GCM10025857_68460 [Alicyclobacillus contaminans]|nr:hypothetical protein GCM10025857_68460 [Alicyclobacillus contaminans]
MQVPKFANGGILTGPTLALAGEAGPEAILPLNDSTMGRLANAIVSKMGAVVARDSSPSTSTSATSSWPHMCGTTALASYWRGNKG